MGLYQNDYNVDFLEGVGGFWDLIDDDDDVGTISSENKWLLQFITHFSEVLIF